MKSATHGRSVGDPSADESPRVSAWLRAAADWFDDSTRGAAVPTPKPLTFLEPNLSFRVAGGTLAGPVVAVDLDIEFHPTPQGRKAAGDPFTLTIAASPGALRQAATDWDEELAAFPTAWRSRPAPLRADRVRQPGLGDAFRADAALGSLGSWLQRVVPA